MSVYPNRNKCFAHNYSRVIVESGAACDIGMDALCLCMHIAHLEDARHYSGPVKEWNSRLCQVFGVSDNKLRRIRDKAVEAGWLHYERGNTRFVGVYWALIPSWLGDGVSVPQHVMEANDRADERERTLKRRSIANKRIRDPVLRELVFSRDGHECVACGSPSNLTIDHVAPVRYGGSDDLSNLQTLCNSCNSSKGTGTEVKRV